MTIEDAAVRSQRNTPKRLSSSKVQAEEAEHRREVKRVTAQYQSREKVSGLSFDTRIDPSNRQYADELSDIAANARQTRLARYQSQSQKNNADSKWHALETVAKYADGFNGFIDGFIVDPIKDTANAIYPLLDPKTRIDSTTKMYLAYRLFKGQHKTLVIPLANSLKSSFLKTANDILQSKNTYSRWYAVGSVIPTQLSLLSKAPLVTKLFPPIASLRLSTKSPVALKNLSEYYQLNIAVPTEAKKNFKY